MENGKIASAFVKAQKSFSPALKKSTNPHFKSKYVDLDGCIEAVVDALNENGIAFIQRTHDCEHGVALETLLIHESGEMLSGGIFRVPAIKNDPQAYGSALTYARRYSLMATCGIAPEDDDGNAAKKAYENKKQEQQKPAEKPWLNIDSKDFADARIVYLRAKSKEAALAHIYKSFNISIEALTALKAEASLEESVKIREIEEKKAAAA